MPFLLGSMEALILAILLAGAASLLTAGGAEAALARPTYTAGDRWTYLLTASLGTLPGLNASQTAFGLGLSGIVEVDVLGPAAASVGGTSVPGVQVATLTSGRLNGSFDTIHGSGTFASQTTEVWEGQSELPTVSNSSSSYVLSVSLGITLSVRVQMWVNASNAYASLPTFNLSVGQSAAVPYTANVSVVTAATVIGPTLYNETRGLVAGTWSRQVLDAENVTVEAGTFPTYRLNESLGSFPGLGVMVPGGAAYETAWFSNDVGYFVKRQAFVNGTQVAEMQLRSYTYPAGPQGLTAIQLAMIIGLPLAAAAVVVLFILRRRKRKAAPVTTGSAGPVGELPRKPGGGP